MKKNSNNRVSHQVRISGREALVIMIALRLLADARSNLHYEAMYYYRIFDRVYKIILAKRLCVIDHSK